jgi:hypothetical protein
MTPVFSAPDLTRVSYARTLLEAAEIPCVIQNELTRTVGPSIYGFSHKTLLDPVLCVLDENHVAAAKDILSAQLGPEAEAGPEWACPACNESNPATFDLCWNCGAARS